jgi:DNA-binding CsgD family transcriptional regulator
VARLRAVFERSRNPMLIADDQRRLVSGNAAVCDLLGITREEVAWHQIDDFTSPGMGWRLEEMWEPFLKDGAAEGWHSLSVPGRGELAVEFSATANVLPSRHLVVFIPPDEHFTEPAERPVAREPKWRPVVAGADVKGELTEREREIVTLVAAGLQNPEIADRLFLSPETVKSHVRNAMAKLGTHTRAGAVTIALVTGQISWEI